MGRFAGWRCRVIRRISTAPIKLALELFPHNEILNKWMRLARGRFAFQGLPARICWLGYGERAEMGLALNELVRKGRTVGAGGDRARSSRYRVRWRALIARQKRCWMGRMLWRIGRFLNALLNTASGASWVSFHHGGGVGMGYSLHAGSGNGGGWNGECTRSG